MRELDGSISSPTMAVWLNISKRKWFVGTFILLVTLLLSTYHQPYYPKTWIDEGFVLQGAMNLATYGQYATRSSEGFRPFDQPLIANGPGVVVPISLAFKLFGIGLVQARIVMAAFLLITSVAFLYLADKMYGLFAAVVAFFLLLSIPEQGYLVLGRHALGMIPALLYFLVGYMFFLKSLADRSKLWYPILAGMMFGFAMVTKGQYTLLLPVLAAVMAIDLVYFQQKSFRTFFLILIAIFACLLLWYGIQFIRLGREGFFANLQKLSESAAVSVVAFRPIRIPDNIWYLFRSGILFLVLPGWLYAIKLVSRRENPALGQVFLHVFVAIWLLWFVLVTVGFERYAFDPYMVGVIFTGKLVNDILYSLTHDNGLLPRSLLGIKYWKQTVVGLLLAITAISSYGFLNQINLLISEPDTSPQQFAKYLNETMKGGEIIESWEWELDILTPGLTYHHPTNTWVDQMTLKRIYQIPVNQTYDPSVYQPQYLIDGSFSRWTAIYKEYLKTGCCELVMQIKEYELYRVKD